MQIKNQQIENNIESIIGEVGISKDEYNLIKKILGRMPNEVEIGMYGVMWSEHCSYKNSIVELKKLPRTGKYLLAGGGEENAGIVDIGNGLAVVFKIESHNHPSAIEPYQGAATGLGGIMRDIFAMGARPIAALNSLRFGNLTNPKTRYMLKRVVRGIGDYGNSFGVPTIGGDIYFDNCYNDNPLVNVMAVGIVDHSKIIKGIGKGHGNIVMLVGSSTGRDGIRGASFASKVLSIKSEHEKQWVQVGDPLTEKLLLEAILEANQLGLIIGMQDLGAGGITCATAEMSARGKSGIKLYIEKIPLRNKEMSDYEIMLSESQERMLIIVKPENQESVKKIFKKWDLQCESIGEITSDGMLQIYRKGVNIANVPANSLVMGGGAPVYIRESKIPEYIEKLREFNENELPEPINYNECLMEMISSPNIISRRWIYEQYDTMVRTNTLLFGNSDANVIRLKGEEKALAIKTDCNSRYVYLNPYKGSQIAVAESARNVVCVGAKPIAITNCLNFGNPYNQEVYWQFKETIKGILDACNVFNTPVTGGNVSFYNESKYNTIFPTPVIGMLGILENHNLIVTPYFKNKGDIIILIGETKGHIGGSEYLYRIFNKIVGDAPDINLQDEKLKQSVCLHLIKESMINSCHDLSEGGLAITLLECCIFNSIKGDIIGVNVSIKRDIRKDFYLFGEDQSRILISVSPDNLTKVASNFEKFGLYYEILGEVTESGRFIVEDTIDIETNVAKSIYFQDLI